MLDTQDDAALVLEIMRAKHCVRRPLARNCVRVRVCVRARVCVVVLVRAKLV